MTSGVRDGAEKDDRWPDRLGGYDVVSTLSVGGMGAVLLATRRAHGFEKRVAIKVVLPHLIGDAHAQSLFADEARLAARFVHPNLVPTFDFGKQDDVLYLVMELVEGASFLKLLRTVNAPLPPLLAARLIADAARGLAWAHTLADDDGRPLRVVHRDISPDNLFISRVGAVKVLDFGIANSRHRSNETVVGLVRGKPGYMSPERARGELVDDRTDTWSLGVVFHELLTGERLFAGQGQALLDAVASMPVTPLPSTVPATLVDIVGSMLRRRHAERIRMGDVVVRLDAFMLAQGASQTTSGMLALVEGAAPGLLGQGQPTVDVEHAGRPEGIATADVATHSPATTSVYDPTASQPPDRRAPMGTGSHSDADRVRPRAVDDVGATHPMATRSWGSGVGVGLGAAIVLGATLGVVWWTLPPDSGASPALILAMPPPSPPLAASPPTVTQPLVDDEPGVDDDVPADVVDEATIVTPVAQPPRGRSGRRRSTRSSVATKARAAIVVPDRTPYVDVFVDGVKVGVSPLGSARRPFAMTAGHHTIRLVDASTGAVVLQKHLTLNDGDVTTIR